MPGPEEFAQRMRDLDVTVEQRGPLVIVQVEVPLGSNAGVVAVGADPPADFPRVPPHWVHLPASIELPGGSRQPSELGADWSKWSRPHKRWSGGSTAAQQWLAHARALLAA
jgi:hypothetical protein